MVSTRSTASAPSPRNPVAIARPIARGRGRGAGRGGRAPRRGLTDRERARRVRLVPNSLLPRATDLLRRPPLVQPRRRPSPAPRSLSGPAPVPAEAVPPPATQARVLSIDLTVPTEGLDVSRCLTWRELVAQLRGRIATLEDSQLYLNRMNTAFQKSQCDMEKRLQRNAYATVAVLEAIKTANGEDTVRQEGNCGICYEGKDCLLMDCCEQCICTECATGYLCTAYNQDLHWVIVPRCPYCKAGWCLKGSLAPTLQYKPTYSPDTTSDSDAED